MLLPTMTLDELYDAVYADYESLVRKLYEFAKDFGRCALKTQKFPLKRKYVYKSYKSNIEYTYYMKCYKRREWDNPRYSIITSYAHDEGSTVLSIDMEKERVLLVFTSHFWTRFRERYLNDRIYSTQETFDFYFSNVNTQVNVDGVMRDNTDKHVPDENIEYFAIINCMGVCFCEREKDSERTIEIYNTFLSTQMLANEQYRNTFLGYLFVYMQDYIIQNPNEKAKIDKLLDDFCSEADDQNWPMDKVIKESEKLMDKYPLYVV